jgi:hypothetical protein
MAEAMAVASPETPPRQHVLKRLFLGALVALVGINIWTGAPLLALWIGSRLQPDTQPTMMSVFLVAFLLALFCGGLVALLGRLSLAYDRARGMKPPPRQQAPWMRSMRGERAKDLKRERPTTGAEKIMIAVVVLAIVSFEVWFFFFASSPLPQS